MNWSRPSPRFAIPFPRISKRTSASSSATTASRARSRLLGPAYHLPPPISMTNSAWLRGYPTPAPTTLIVIGFSRERAERNFTGCRVAGHNGNSLGVKNEESQDHPDILRLRPTAQALACVLEEQSNDSAEFRTYGMAVTCHR